MAPDRLQVWVAVVNVAGAAVVTGEVALLFAASADVTR
jgi:hypothetical protein